MKNIALWCLTVYFGAAAVSFLPKTAGFLAVLAAVMVTPVRKWQDYLNRYFLGKAKVILAAVFIVLTFIAAPESVAVENPETVEPTVTVETAVETTETTASMTEQTDPKTEQTNPVTEAFAEEISETILATVPATKQSPVKTAEMPATMASTSEPEETEAEIPGKTGTYILNTSSKKFHDPDCPYAGKISEKNKDYYTGSREELIAKGYSPCGHCDP